MRSFPAFFGRTILSYQSVTGLLLFCILSSQFSFLGILLPQAAEAAVVTIDTTVSTTATAHIFAGSQTVFTSDQTGYKFYVDSTGVCAYSKTLNGGTSWGTPVTVDSQTDCASIAVWYDQWTPGDYGTIIHIGTMDTASTTDSLWYNQLNTSGDTLLLGSSPVNAVSNSAQVPTFVVGINNVALTKGTDGVVYLVSSDASDSFVVKCTSSCNTSGGWSEAGSAFMDLDNDWNLLQPLSGGSILLINRDISADDLRSRVWNGSSWSGSWNVFDSSAVESQTYDVGMAAVVDQSTGDVLLAYGADHDNYTTLDHDVRTAKYVSGSWTSTAAVFTNTTRGLNSLAIARDTNIGTVYVAYSLRTTPATPATGNVYYATSTSAMSSWGSEVGPVNSTPGDIYGLDLNVMSDERIFATWEDPSPDDIFGETIADIAAVTKVETVGTPTTSITASTSNVYTGGAFAIKESLASRNVTDIIITESGTVDGAAAVSNISLRYDLDTSAPYNCASESYSGSESTFGLTDTNGFSGSNGVSAFTGFVNITSTQSMCVYVILDVTDDAVDGSTLRLSINNPPTDIVVTGGVTLKPLVPVGFAASTTILNDRLTQTHFHWRNDNGNETAATSATGGVQDTTLAAILANNARRLRLQVSNEGSITAPSSRFRLEYAEAAPTCDVASVWTDVNATNDAWNLFDSTFVTDGSDTTDISVGSGGVANENSTFLTPNGGVRDTTSETGSLTLSNTNFVELEYSLVASTTATQGTTYCFRVTSAGTPLPSYSVYPSATISADVTVSATGTQTTSMPIPSSNNYLGGAFVFRENLSSRTITGVTLTENGTVDAFNNIQNVKMRYDLDTSAPYNCASESYSGAETQFGSTDADGFSGSNGTSSFSGSVSVSTTQAVCMYAVVDIGAGAQSSDTVQIELAAGGDDVTLSSGSISPSTPIAISGTTTLIGAIIAQTGYHWRNDNGSQATATSLTLGMQNTLLTDVAPSTTVRLRVAISNEGAATSTAAPYRLEFGPKITTCSAVSVWTGVGDAPDDWNMSPSVHLTEGDNTTNIATSTGGITDPNPTFLASNGGVRDISATSSSFALSPTEFTELEFSITSTAIIAYNTVYCFRVTSAGNPLPQYDQYAEVRTAARRDFKVQSGTATVTGTGLTLTAGVDYIAPAATSTSFVRITNTHNTGAGKNSAGGAQNARDVTAYISNPGNLLTSFIISRPAGALNNTRVSWEIVEFIADPGTDNEMKVRGASSLQMAAGSTTATGTVISTIADDSDVVVFVTGVHSRNATRNTYYASQVTASWNSVTKQPVFTRGASGATIIDISYAVVEYTGVNWSIQRIEHTYTGTSSAETESMSPVNSLARTFIHTQKRMTAQVNVNNFGHEVWLSSIGAVSFQLEPAATSPAGHTSVAWVIENKQTSAGAVKVQRTSGNTTDGTEPVSLVVSLFSPIASLNNTSIFATTRVVGANSNFPLPYAGISLTSTSSYTIWRSEASTALLTYRTEVVEWPTNGLAVRQNYYRIYADNNTLIPTDPWPVGGSDLGENTPLSIADEPLGEGDHVRLRMSLRVSNANLPAGLYDFKLQYGLRLTSCSAVATWTDIGAVGSGAVWRGFNATGTLDGVSLSGNPPTGGDLLLSVADVAGSYVEQNPSPANPFVVLPTNDVEYDWHIEQNGAVERSTYCFRMSQSDGTQLDGYFNYPQIRTASFNPVTQNWRWYDDATSTTPTTDLAVVNTAPIEIVNENAIVLRVTVGETKRVQGQNVKFKLQFDENAAFTNPRDVAASSICHATSTWCYAASPNIDNATITARVLSDGDACVSGVGNGCGTHNTSPTFVFGKSHLAGANTEYAFYLKNTAARAGAVYYFRLYDMFNEFPVIARGGYTQPSLVAESATLALSISGLPSGTTTAGAVTTATSTANTIAFGSIPLNTDWYAAHRITVTTNATEGYRVLSFARAQLLNTYGSPIPSITGTNALPVSWAVGCSGGASGCVGYHTTDATLSNGSTRFSPLDSYSGLETTPKEIMYSSIPSSDIHDILYKVRVGQLQPAGQYQTEIVYVAVPTY